MTNFNFLSKSSSQSCGHSSVTLASTVGSPSAHRRSTMLRLLSVLVLVLTFGVGNVWGAEGTNHDKSQSLSQLLNNNAKISSINIADPGYTVKEVIVTWSHNKNISNAVTIEVSVGETSFGSANVTNGTSKTTSFKTSPQTSVSGAISITFTNNTGDGTGHGTFSVSNVRLVEGAPATKYDVHWSINGVVVEDEELNGKPSVPEDVADLAEDEECNGKVFVGWTATAINGSTNTAPTDLFTEQAGTAISGETTYHAVYATATPGGTSWQKTNSIAVNDVVIFVYKANSVSKELTGVTTSGTTIGTATDFATNPAASYPLTIVAGNTNGSYAFKNSSNKYLSWSSGNSLTTANSVANASSWTISTSTDGNFKFANVGSTGRILQYNASSPRWACYDGNGQTAFHIYKQATVINYSNYATFCCTSLGQINGSFFGTTHFGALSPEKFRPERP